MRNNLVNLYIYTRYDKVDGEWKVAREADGSIISYEMRDYEADHLNSYSTNIKYVRGGGRQIYINDSRHQQELIDETFGKEEADNMEDIQLYVDEEGNTYEDEDVYEDEDGHLYVDVEDDEDWEYEEEEETPQLITKETNMEELPGIIMKLQEKLTEAEKVVKPSAGKILLLASAAYAAYQLIRKSKGA